MATGRRNQTRDSDSAKVVRLFDLAARVRADGAGGDAASPPRRPSRPGAKPRPRVPRGRPLLGSHPARTDGEGRIAIPAPFRACHRDGGWLACVAPESATLIPRSGSSPVVTGVPIRSFAGSRARHAVVLGPAWADSEVVVVGNVEDLRVLRKESMQGALAHHKGPGIPALPDPRLSGRISTGFHGLDEAIGGGLWTGELATIGGPPGVGLSTLLLQVALSVTRRGARVAWIGSHLLPGAVRLRVESLVARVSSLALAHSFIDIELPPVEAGRVRKARTLLARAPISVTCGARTLDDLEAAVAVAAESGALLAVLDNVVFPPGGTRPGSARLRAIARERVIAVLVATRTTRTDLPSSPKVTDVRGFAAASQEGSSVVLLHRPGVFSLPAGCDEDEAVLLGTHGEGRLRFRRDHGPRFEDVPIGRRR